MQIKDLTIEEFKLLIKETVTETIQSLLMDPDEGQQLKPEVIAKDRNIRIRRFNRAIAMENEKFFWL